MIKGQQEILGSWAKWSLTAPCPRPVLTLTQMMTNLEESQPWFLALWTEVCPVKFTTVQWILTKSPLL